MIPTTLRVTLLLAILAYFVLILWYLKCKALELKYTLLWLLAGIIMFIMVMFPELLFILTRAFGFESNMNALYVICLGFIMMLLMMLTSIVSRQANKIKILIQEIAIMKKEIRDMQGNKLEGNSEEDNIN